MGMSGPDGNGHKATIDFPLAKFKCHIATSSIARGNAVVARALPQRVARKWKL